jgi:hypothetical protein
MMMNLFKDFSVLSWNVRGAVNRGGKRHCKELVRNYLPTFSFLLLETHVFLLLRSRNFGRISDPVLWLFPNT